MEAVELMEEEAGEPEHQVQECEQKQKIDSPYRQMMVKFVKKLRLVLGRTFVPAPHLQQQQQPLQQLQLQPLPPPPQHSVMAVIVKEQQKN